MKLVIRPAVERDLDEAGRWYEARQIGLRRIFLEAVGDTFSLIEENPLLYPAIHLEIRRASIRRFPYGVFYALLGNQIHILAVVHDARHPSVWRRRLGKSRGM